MYSQPVTKIFLKILKKGALGYIIYVLVLGCAITEDSEKYKSTSPTSHPLLHNPYEKNIYLTLCTAKKPPFCLRLFSDKQI